jgi:hypothetical protein
MPDGATAYMASWGNYAALSPTRDCVTATPGGLTITPTAAKELDAHDICDLFNMPQVRTRVLPVFMASRQMVMMQMSMAFSQQPTMAKYAPALKVFIGQALDLVQNFISQCDDVTLGASLSPDGISGAVVMDFNSTSHYGQMVASITDTDKSLLGGIPAGNYLLFGGAVTDPKVSSQFISEFLDPVLPELQNLGADGQPYLDAIQSLKDNAAAQTGGSVAFLVPEGELGTSPLMQFIAVKNGDAKTISASVDKILQTEADQAKAGAAGGPAGMSLPMQMTYTPAAKTVDGVTFDQFHTGFDMAGALTPQIAKIGQYLSFLYGSDGMNIYGGIVNDATYLQVGGLTDDKISTAIAAARSGDDPLAKLTGVQNTAAKLPTQRVAAFYVPLDTIVNTVFTYMGKFGLDMGVTMPASDPIGVVSSTDGSAVRIDLYVPGQLITSSAQVAGKLMLHRAGANPGGGPPPPPGGGL